LEKFITEKFSEFTAAIAKADCKAELRRRLKVGPPAWVWDNDGLPIPDGDTHIDRVWYAEDKKEFSARLIGSHTPDSRAHEKLWNKLSLVMTLPPEPVEGEVFEDSGDEDPEFEIRKAAAKKIADANTPAEATPSPKEDGGGKGDKKGGKDDKKAAKDAAKKAKDDEKAAKKAEKDAAQAKKKAEKEAAAAKKKEEKEAKKAAKKKK
jgi:hypothetical protein